MHFDNPAFLANTGSLAQTASIVGTVSSTSSPARFGDAFVAANANSYVTVPGGPEFSFPAGTDFTLEAWVYANSTMSTGYAQVLGKWTPPGASFEIFMQAGIPRYAIIDSTGAARQMNGSTALTLNAWNHIAVTREGTTTSLYLNGARIATGTTYYSESIGYVANELVGIGRLPLQANYGMGTKGVIDEVRITRGVARYTGASYSVPTAPFQNP